MRHSSSREKGHGCRTNDKDFVVENDNKNLKQSSLNNTSKESQFISKVQNENQNSKLCTSYSSSKKLENSSNPVLNLETRGISSNDTFINHLHSDIQSRSLYARNAMDNSSDSSPSKMICTKTELSYKPSVTTECEKNNSGNIPHDYDNKITPSLKTLEQQSHLTAKERPTKSKSVLHQKSPLVRTNPENNKHKISSKLINTKQDLRNKLNSYPQTKFNLIQNKKSLSEQTFIKQPVSLKMKKQNIDSKDKHKIDMIHREEFSPETIITKTETHNDILSMESKKINNKIIGKDKFLKNGTNKRKVSSFINPKKSPVRIQEDTNCNNGLNYRISQMPSTPKQNLEDNSRTKYLSETSIFNGKESKKDSEFSKSFNKAGKYLHKSCIQITQNIERIEDKNKLLKPSQITDKKKEKIRYHHECLVSSDGRSKQLVDLKKKKTYSLHNQRSKSLQTKFSVMASKNDYPVSLRENLDSFRQIESQEHQPLNQSSKTDKFFKGENVRDEKERKNQLSAIQHKSEEISSYEDTEILKNKLQNTDLEKLEDVKPVLQEQHIIIAVQRQLTLNDIEVQPQAVQQTKSKITTPNEQPHLISQKVKDFTTQENLKMEKAKYAHKRVGKINFEKSKQKKIQQINDEMNMENGERITNNIPSKITEQQQNKGVFQLNKYRIASVNHKYTGKPEEDMTYKIIRAEECVLLNPSTAANFKNTGTSQQVSEEKTNDDEYAVKTTEIIDNSHKHDLSEEKVKLYAISKQFTKNESQFESPNSMGKAQVPEIQNEQTMTRLRKKQQLQYSCVKQGMIEKFPPCEINVAKENKTKCVKRETKLLPEQSTADSIFMNEQLKKETKLQNNEMCESLPKDEIKFSEMLSEEIKLISKKEIALVKSHLSHFMNISELVRNKLYEQQLVHKGSDKLASLKDSDIADIKLKFLEQFNKYNFLESYTLMKLTTNGSKLDCSNISQTSTKSINSISLYENLASSFYNHDTAQGKKSQQLHLDTQTSESHPCKEENLGGKSTYKYECLKSSQSFKPLLCEHPRRTKNLDGKSAYKYECLKPSETLKPMLCEHPRTKNLGEKSTYKYECLKPSETLKPMLCEHPRTKNLGGKSAYKYECLKPSETLKPMLCEHPRTKNLGEKSTYKYECLKSSQSFKPLLCEHPRRTKNLGGKSAYKYECLKPSETLKPMLCEHPRRTKNLGGKSAYKYECLKPSETLKPMLCEHPRTKNLGGKSAYKYECLKSSQKIKPQLCEMKFRPTINKLGVCNQSNYETNKHNMSEFSKSQECSKDKIPDDTGVKKSNTCSELENSKPKYTHECLKLSQKDKPKLCEKIERKRLNYCKSHSKNTKEQKGVQPKNCEDIIRKKCCKLEDLECNLTREELYMLCKSLLKKHTNNSTLKMCEDDKMQSSKEVEKTKVIKSENNCPEIPEGKGKHPPKVSPMKNLRDGFNCKFFFKSLKEGINLKVLKEGIKNAVNWQQIKKAVKENIKLREIMEGFKKGLKLKDLLTGLKNAFKPGVLGKAIKEGINWKKIKEGIKGSIDFNKIKEAITDIYKNSKNNLKAMSGKKRKKPPPPNYGKCRKKKVNQCKEQSNPTCDKNKCEKYNFAAETLDFIMGNKSLKYITSPFQVVGHISKATYTKQATPPDNPDIQNKIKPNEEPEHIKPAERNKNTKTCVFSQTPLPSQEQDQQTIKLSKKSTHLQNLQLLQRSVQPKNEQGNAQSLNIQPSQGTVQSQHAKLLQGNAELTQNAQPLKRSAQPQNAQTSQGISYPQNVQSSQGISYPQNIQTSQGSDHPQNVQTSQGISYPQNVQSSQGIFYPQNVQSSQGISYPQNVQSSQGISYPQNVQTSQGISYPQNVQTSQGISYPQNVQTSQGISYPQNVQTSQGISYPQNVQTSQGISYPQNVQSSQGSDHTQNVQTSQGISYPQNVQTSQGISYPQNVQTSQGISYPQNVQSSQGSDHPQNVQTSQGIYYPQNVQSSQGSDHTQNVQSSQGSDHTQNVQSSQGISYPQNVQSSQGSDHTQNVQTSQGISYPQNVQTSQGISYPQNVQTSQGISYPQNVQSSQGSDHTQNVQTSQGISYPQNVQTSQGISYPQNVQTSQGISYPQNVQSSQGSDHPQNVQTSQGIYYPQNVQSSQGSDHTQNVQSSQGSDHTQNVQSSQGISYPQNVQSSQGSDHPQNVQTSQGISYPQNVQSPQGSDHPQNVQTSQGSDHPQNAQSSQGISYPKNVQSQGSDHPQTTFSPTQSQTAPTPQFFMVVHQPQQYTVDSMQNALQQNNQQPVYPQHVLVSIQTMDTPLKTQHTLAQASLEPKKIQIHETSSPTTQNDSMKVNISHVSTTSCHPSHSPHFSNESVISKNSEIQSSTSIQYNIMPQNLSAATPQMSEQTNISTPRETVSYKTAAPQASKHIAVSKQASLPQSSVQNEHQSSTSPSISQNVSALERSIMKPHIPENMSPVLCNTESLPRSTDSTIQHVSSQTICSSENISPDSSVSRSSQYHLPFVQESTPETIESPVIQKSEELQQKISSQPSQSYEPHSPQIVSSQSNSINTMQEQTTISSPEPPNSPQVQKPQTEGSVPTQISSQITHFPKLIQTSDLSQPHRAPQISNSISEKKSSIPSPSSNSAQSELSSASLPIPNSLPMQSSMCQTRPSNTVSIKFPNSSPPVSEPECLKITFKPTKTPGLAPSHCSLQLHNRPASATLQTPVPPAGLVLSQPVSPIINSSNKSPCSPQTSDLKQKEAPTPTPQTSSSKQSQKLCSSHPPSFETESPQPQSSENFDNSNSKQCNSSLSPYHFTVSSSSEYDDSLSSHLPEGESKTLTSSAHSQSSVSTPINTNFPPLNSSLIPYVSELQTTPSHSSYSEMTLSPYYLTELEYSSARPISRNEPPSSERMTKSLSPYNFPTSLLPPRLSTSQVLSFDSGTSGLPCSSASLASSYNNIPHPPVTPALPHNMHLLESVHTRETIPMLTIQEKSYNSKENSPQTPKPMQVIQPSQVAKQEPMTSTQVKDKHKKSFVKEPVIPTQGSTESQVATSNNQRSEASMKLREAVRVEALRQHFKAEGLKDALKTNTTTNGIILKHHIREKRKSIQTMSEKESSEISKLSAANQVLKAMVSFYESKMQQMKKQIYSDNKAKTEAKERQVKSDEEIRRKVEPASSKILKNKEEKDKLILKTCNISVDKENNKKEDDKLIPKCIMNSIRDENVKNTVDKSKPSQLATDKQNESNFKENSKFDESKTSPYKEVIDNREHILNVESSMISNIKDAVRAEEDKLKSPSFKVPINKECVSEEDKFKPDFLKIAIKNIEDKSNLNKSRISTQKVGVKNPEESSNTATGTVTSNLEKTEEKLQSKSSVDKDILDTSVDKLNSSPKTPIHKDVEDKLKLTAREHAVSGTNMKMANVVDTLERVGEGNELKPGMKIKDNIKVPKSKGSLENYTLTSSSDVKTRDKINSKVNEEKTEIHSTKEIEKPNTEQNNVKNELKTNKNTIKSMTNSKTETKNTNEVNNLKADLQKQKCQLKIPKKLSVQESINSKTEKQKDIDKITLQKQVTKDKINTEDKESADGKFRPKIGEKKVPKQSKLRSCVQDKMKLDNRKTNKSKLISKNKNNATELSQVKSENLNHNEVKAKSNTTGTEILKLTSENLGNVKKEMLDIDRKHNKEQTIKKNKEKGDNKTYGDRKQIEKKNYHESKNKLKTEELKTFDQMKLTQETQEKQMEEKLKMLNKHSAQNIPTADYKNIPFGKSKCTVNMNKSKSEMQRKRDTITETNLKKEKKSVTDIEFNKINPKLQDHSTQHENKIDYKIKVQRITHSLPNIPKLGEETIANIEKNKMNDVSKINSEIPLDDKRFSIKLEGPRKIEENRLKTKRRNLLNVVNNKKLHPKHIKENRLKTEEWLNAVHDRLTNKYVEDAEDCELYNNGTLKTEAEHQTAEDVLRKEIEKYAIDDKRQSEILGSSGNNLEHQKANEHQRLKKDPTLKTEKHSDNTQLKPIKKSNESNDDISPVTKTMVRLDKNMVEELLTSEELSNISKSGSSEKVITSIHGKQEDPETAKTPEKLDGTKLDMKNSSRPVSANFGSQVSSARINEAADEKPKPKQCRRPSGRPRTSTSGDPELKGLSYHINSQTIRGRANVAKATYALLGLGFIYYLLKTKPKQPASIPPKD